MRTFISAHIKVSNGDCRSLRQFSQSTWRSEHKIPNPRISQNRHGSKRKYWAQPIKRCPYDAVWVLVVAPHTMLGFVDFRFWSPKSRPEGGGSEMFLYTS